MGGMWLERKKWRGDGRTKSWFMDKRGDGDMFESKFAFDFD